MDTIQKIIWVKKIGEKSYKAHSNNVEESRNGYGSTGPEAVKNYVKINDVNGRDFEVRM
jgi:hypothetical protein